MKPINSNARANQIVSKLVFCVMIVLFYSCGSGGGGSDSSETGAVSFGLAMQNSGTIRALGNRQLDDGTSQIDCTSHEIATIEAQVVDEIDNLLAEGGPFDCEDHQGTITGVEQGDFRVVKIIAKDLDGFDLYSGESEPGPVIAGETNVFGTIILKPLNLATVEGIVTDAVTGSPLGDVTVDKLNGDPLVDPGLTDSSGVYSLDVPPASGFLLEFSKAGFLTEIYHNVSAEVDTVTTLETVRLISEANSGPGDVSGTIVSALDGTGVSGLTVALRKGINTNSGPVVTTTTTESGGLYSFINLDAGNYTAEVGGSGFITTYFTVINIGGITTPNQDASISPVISPGETRIILTWGQTPEDLDSHLTGPLADESRFHLYFETIGSWPDIVELDLDDTDSFGPETTTIIQQIDGVYRFSVHDYTNMALTDVDDSFALADSGAQVRVFRDNGLIATFNVPVSQEGTLWTVFEMSADTITPINLMSYQQDPDSIP